LGFKGLTQCHLTYTGQTTTDCVECCHIALHEYPIALLDDNKKTLI